MQIHGLLMDKSNEQIGRNIGEAVGQVLEFEGNKSTCIWCVPFIRVRVLFKTSSPLPPGYWLTRSNMEAVRVHFKFERIFVLCYGCERLGHINLTVSSMLRERMLKVNMDLG